MVHRLLCVVDCSSGFRVQGIGRGPGSRGRGSRSMIFCKCCAMSEYRALLWKSRISILIPSTLNLPTLPPHPSNPQKPHRSSLAARHQSGRQTGALPTSVWERLLHPGGGIEARFLPRCCWLGTVPCTLAGHDSPKPCFWACFWRESALPSQILIFSVAQVDERDQRRQWR